MSRAASAALATVSVGIVVVAVVDDDLASLVTQISY
jgi:hypothetical protein